MPVMVWHIAHRPRPAQLCADQANPNYRKDWCAFLLLGSGSDRVVDRRLLLGSAITSLFLFLCR